MKAKLKKPPFHITVYINKAQPLVEYRDYDPFSV